MLARIWFRLDRPLRWEEKVTVRTWHRGSKTALMYRDFDLLAGGVPVGEAVSAWVLAGVEDRKLLRLSQMRELEGTEGGGLCKQMTLSKLRMPGEMEERDRRRMGYSDTDINGHVNNTRYADFVCDALRLEGLPRSRFLSDLQIGYTAESRAGDVLTLEVGEQGGQHFVKGVDEAGKRDSLTSPRGGGYNRKNMILKSQHHSLLLERKGAVNYGQPGRFPEVCQAGAYL